jgi:hypothetical protein
LHALRVRELEVYRELGLVSLKTEQLSPVQQTFRRLCRKYFDSP